MRVTFATANLTPTFREETVDLRLAFMQGGERVELMDEDWARELPNSLRSAEVSFKVCRLFASQEACDEFVLTHEAALPITGALSLGCGPSTGGSTVQSADCTLSRIEIGPQLGVSVWVNYQFRGGPFEKVASS